MARSLFRTCFSKLFFYFHFSLPKLLPVVNIYGSGGGRRGKKWTLELLLMTQIILDRPFNPPNKYFRYTPRMYRHYFVVCSICLPTMYICFSFDIYIMIIQKTYYYDEEHDGKNVNWITKVIIAIWLLLNNKSSAKKNQIS